MPDIDKNEVIIRVRYKDTDQMGVAYYANYLVWFEVGRTELMRSLDLPYLEFEKNDLYLPVLKAHCEYRQPALYDDQIEITTKIEKLQDVRLTFTYKLKRTGTLLAEGYTEHAFINQSGKPVVLRKKNPFLWNRLVQAYEDQAKKGGE